ncbi:haloacid dehalogenase, type II [Lichtheimia ornata]|uniref:Haloacid dehalogenase, type II n=1 Tax=Lichtheimia ornata TaxID=688661 RepID=A0AAD7XRJ3_9FUNG|nr:haloacid dehalogenase, type II [Lichtheimia ornata]KAJ8651785.1 haloacid dehalogenase, type II [Lichtheimia ornata]
MGKADLSHVKALTIDVFGTCVDWRSCIEKALEEAIGASPAPDYAALAHKWRKGYKTAMQHYASQKGPIDPYPNLDDLHRELLDNLLDKDPEFNHLSTLVDESARTKLTQAWHHLTPWEDTNPGLGCLSNELGLITSTLSNGNMRLLVDMKKFGQMPFDIILSSELFGTYKTNPKIYQGAAQMLGLPPRSICMVATHLHDLKAAKANGYTTAFIPRPKEDKQVLDEEDFQYVDVVADSFVQLAEIFRK